MKMSFDESGINVDDQNNAQYVSSNRLRCSEHGGNCKVLVEAAEI
jgi:hypothetical protein